MSNITAIPFPFIPFLALCVFSLVIIIWADISDG